jgi:NADH:ubiquinone reductase (H+-translocating)
MTRRILVIGAGFAGMWSALGAARLAILTGHEEGVEVVLIAPQPYLHVRPRLYEENAASMRAPLLDIFASVGVRFVQGFVQTIEQDGRSVTYADAAGHIHTLGCDRLSLAAGSTLNRPSIPGLAEHSFSVDQIDEAAVLETHLMRLDELPESRARNTVVVGGGGFTGIETAAEMPHRLRAILGSRADVRVVVVEQSAHIGPELGAGPRPVIEEALAELGVELHLGDGVAMIDAQGIVTQAGTRIPAQTVVWTAGARANPLTRQIVGARDAFGRLHVDRTLKVIGQTHIYATGDVARAETDDEGNLAAMSCQHAMNLGRSAGHNAAADLLGLDPIPYEQPFYVTCLDLGPWGAVYTEGWDRQVKMRGEEAKSLKRKINTEWIYPPRADRAEVLEAADPLRIVVA